MTELSRGTLRVHTNPNLSGFAARRIGGEVTPRRRREPSVVGASVVGAESTGLRLVVCDGHRLFAESLSVVFESRGHHVVACTDDTEEVVRAVKQHAVDVCVIDLGSGPDVTSAIGRVRTVSPGTKCMVLSAQRDALATAAARDAGAVAFEHKTAPVDRVVAKVAEVAELGDEMVLAPSIDETVDPWSRDPLARFLTPREREVLVGLTEGVTTRELAERLGVSVATVRSHIQSVLVKLGVHSRLEAVVYVAQRSLPLSA